MVDGRVAATKENIEESGEERSQWAGRRVRVKDEMEGSGAREVTGMNKQRIEGTKKILRRRL